LKTFLLRITCPASEPFETFPYLHPPQFAKRLFRTKLKNQPFHRPPDSEQALCQVRYTDYENRISMYQSRSSSKSSFCTWTIPPLHAYCVRLCQPLHNPFPAISVKISILRISDF